MQCVLNLREDNIFKISERKKPFFIHKTKAKHESMVKIFFILSLLLFACGCSNLQSIHKRFENADVIAKSANLQKENIYTDNFLLTTFHRGLKNIKKDLVVYIEGDGSAWKGKYRLSENPTPKNPVALKLAAKDATDSILYIARPCMYLEQKLMHDCPAKFWSSHRYSEEVISSINQVIDWATGMSLTNSLTIIGYSGGGTVAALIAARRNDVASLITIASNLDHKYWTDMHNISPLIGSLSPLEYAGSLSTIEQTHFVGAKDKMVPRAIVESYLLKMPLKDKIKINVIEDFDHSCCWEKVWPELLNTTRKN